MKEIASLIALFALTGLSQGAIGMFASMEIEQDSFFDGADVEFQHLTDLDLSTTELEYGSFHSSVTEADFGSFGLSDPVILDWELTLSEPTNLDYILLGPFIARPSPSITRETASVPEPSYLALPIALLPLVFFMRRKKSIAVD